MIAIAVVVFFIFLIISGCATYHGKLVPAKDATAMRALGMNVECVPESFCGKKAVFEDPKP